jgi:hypothetical protein
VHGNGWHTLGVLDDTTASIWLGQGGVHGETRAVSVRGIDPGGQHGAGGEVTGLGMVGGALPTLGAHSGHGDVQGGVGCSCSVSARWGRCWGVSRAAPKHWGVNGGGVIEEQRERERFWQVASGFPSPLDAKCIGQTEKSF